MPDSFPIGTRVFHLTVHVFGTVVEPDRAMPKDATAVRYDGETTRSGYQPGIGRPSIANGELEGLPSAVLALWNSKAAFSPKHSRALGTCAVMSVQALAHRPRISTSLRCAATIM